MKITKTLEDGTTIRIKLKKGTPVVFYQEAGILLVDTSEKPETEKTLTKEEQVAFWKAEIQRQQDLLRQDMQKRKEAAKPGVVVYAVCGSCGRDFPVGSIHDCRLPNIDITCDSCNTEAVAEVRKHEGKPALFCVNCKAFQRYLQPSDYSRSPAPRYTGPESIFPVTRLRSKEEILAEMQQAGLSPDEALQQALGDSEVLCINCNRPLAPGLVCVCRKVTPPLSDVFNPTGYSMRSVPKRVELNITYQGTPEEAARMAEANQEAAQRIARNAERVDPNPVNPATVASYEALHDMNTSGVESGRFQTATENQANTAKPDAYRTPYTDAAPNPTFEETIAALSAPGVAAATAPEIDDSRINSFREAKRAAKEGASTDAATADESGVVDPLAGATTFEQDWAKETGQPLPEVSQNMTGRAVPVDELDAGVEPTGPIFV